MRKIVFIILALSLVAVACQKENDDKKVTYFIKGFADPYKVIYAYGEANKTIIETVDPQSNLNYTWTYEFSAMPGEITYLYIESKENIVNPKTFLAAILIDGKQYQKASNWDNTVIVASDTLKYIKRSGTIPF